MAIYSIATPYILINSVDLTDHLKDVTLTYEADETETTASNTVALGGNKSYIAGLKSWKIDATIQQDYAAAKTDATLFPLVGAAPFAVLIKPVNTTVSATNPSFAGNVILTSYPPMTGAVGELAVVKITLRGTGALTRATA